MEKLWQHIKKCQNRFDDYLKLKWTQMDIGEMEDEIKKMRTGLQPIKIADRKCNTFVGISEEIKRWSIFIPMISDLKHESMTTVDDRHWSKVKHTVKQDFVVDQNLELKKLWLLRLFDYKEAIEEFCEIAKNEAKMEKEINAIIEFWKVVEFELVPLKNSNVSTLKMLDDHFEILEGHQLSINTMLLSKFVAFFEKLFEKWKQDLGSVYDVVQLLSDVQKTWSFLENLFIHSEEVKKELPEISKQFVGIDIDMREIMKKGGEVKNILRFCTIDGMYKRLDKIQGELKICEKALNEYLDSKRKAFPRFYFVSVNDLLDILSNGNSPIKVNKHSPKIFQAVELFDMEESGDRPTVKGMKSGVGTENVKLVEPLKLVGKVENYLQDIINSIVSTLRTITTRSFANQAKMNREDWIKMDPAQITILVNNVLSSGLIEECFKRISDGSNVNGLKDLFKKEVEMLTGLIKMVQGELTKEDRQKIMCLITLDTHTRDIIEKLDNENVKKADAFQWQSQLKFYWADNEASKLKDCQIRIADASFWYSYEYLGNGPRLVVTPLTDRIYVTATQALHLKMGCAPAGPAGTGKTETTKDLSFALAKAIYVFNCSSEMNYESMGNIYKGLASSGCWGCFDEFNRLLPEVLSVCSVQFKSVTDAVKEKKKRFVLQGDEISLDPTCGVFITMNPGYLGRAELPEGLKALFRPITVVVPDLELICENMLMAEGFVDAKVLAKKFVTLYMLCRDLLSKQLHYDWGLRAIKSVLVVAGVFKRNEPTVSEAALLMRALRDFNLPKIAFADLDIFFGLLGDLFPKIEI
jgi:dynein heavy chain